MALLELAHVLVGCNNSHLVQDRGDWKVIGDPTEGALLAVGAKLGVDRSEVQTTYPKQSEIPFDSSRKLSSVIRRRPDGTLRAYVNGAPDVLMKNCAWVYTPKGSVPLTEPLRQQIEARNSEMGQQALRVLGSALRDLETSVSMDWSAETVERNLVFVGLVGMADPPRAEAKAAIARCREAGIRVTMITGDHPRTAAAISQELGIGDFDSGDFGVRAPGTGAIGSHELDVRSSESAVLTGSTLDALSDKDLRERARGTLVFARVSAEHKLRIVEALRAGHDVVAMTGDGVNDAPAIKGADIGIAMGRAGTEVTKQASDIVLTDDNFATIVAAVEEGRGAYDNIRRTLQYLLAGNVGELLLMTVPVVMGMPAPLLPIHLLWINLVTDGPPALCLAAEPIDPDVMKRRPRPRSQSLTDRRFLENVFLIGTLTASVALAVYFYMLPRHSLETARSYAFSVLIFAELFRSFGARSESRPFWRIPLLSNKPLLVAVLLSFTFQIWSHQNEMLGGFLKTSPVQLADTLWLLALGAIPFLLVDLLKVARIVHKETPPMSHAVEPATANMEERP